MSGLAVGATHRATYTVTSEMRPPHIAGILATSRMIGLVEDACVAAVHPFLDKGQTSVGTRIDITHVGTARVGERVTVDVRLTTITQHRLLGFQISVEAPVGVISTGTHQRLVVECSKFE